MPIYPLSFSSVLASNVNLRNSSVLVIYFLDMEPSIYFLFTVKLIELADSMVVIMRNLISPQAW